jgi:hypothetical protein
MINANDNRKERERRIEIDCWLEGGAPYLVSIFDPTVQPEPIISEMFETPSAARAVAYNYSRIHGGARVYDTTGGAV